MGDDSEWQKLPAEEKCQHKVWKARLAGYEEVTKLFKSFDEKSPEFSKYAGLIKKFVTDSNAVAQEKGLDAALAFVENAPTNVCGRICNDVVNGVVTKCLNASKQKTKDKGMEIIMLFIEAEKPDIVQECLMTGLENKNPKVVIGCIQTITIALRDFGTKVIQVKPLLKHLARLLDDRDKNVREETKLLVIELYRWIGAALKPQMTNFKPIQVQEFEVEFEKLVGGKPQQSRFMRSQQTLKAKMEEQQAAAEAGAGDGAGVEEVEEEAIDPFELMSAVDILPLLPKNFFEQIEAKKWQERKEMLEAVQKLLENPKLEGGDYGGLVRALLKVIAKDTNVMLVIAAAKCITGIANGLRKKYQPYGSQSVSTILEKFKEKKVAVVQALREAIDAAFQSITLEVVMEEVVANLDNKNPSIKTETALFLARCFAKCTQSSLPKKMLKAYVAPLLKTASEAAPDLREASFEALGTAMKVVTEKNIGPFLVDIDSLKMQKIQEWFGKAVLLNAKGEPRGGAGGAVGGATGGASASKPAAAPPAAVEKKGGPPRAGSEAPKAVKKPGGKPAAGGPSKKGGKLKKAGAAEEKLEPILSDESVEEKAQAFFPGDTLTLLVSSNWKERLGAMENFIKVVSSTSSDDIPCQVCVRTVIKKPGLKDTNFQVLKLKLEVLAHLARNSKFSKRSAEFSIPDAVDKVGDVKNGGAAKEAFTAMSEAVGLEYISIEVISRAFEQKSPKNQQESLVWLATAITEFGLKIKVKDTIPVINKALAASNPGVRQAAISLLGVMFMYMGSTLRVLFESEKPTLLQQIDAEFEKVKDTKPPAPTRKMISAGGGADGGEDDDEDEEAAGENGEDAPVEDLLPRVDISERINDALIAELSDKNWKVRQEGLKNVTNILSEAKFVTANLGPLPEALKARLGESNKNLQMTAISICQTLATALGPHCKPHFKIIGPGLINCMSDSKAILRGKVVACMNAWVEHATLLPLVECEALYDGLKMESPILRAELLGWLSERLPTHKQLPVEFRACVPFVLACLEDRNPDVRKKAGEALVPFMIHTGYDAFLKALGKCKPASKDQIQPLLEKARCDLPAKPTKPKKAAADAAPSTSKPKSAPKAAAAAAPMPMEDEDEPEPEKPAAPAASKGKVGKGKGKSAPAASSKKKIEDEDCGPLISVTVTKEQRIKEEKAMKVLKWNFIELRAEFIEQLRGQMEKNFNKQIIADLFQTDFKYHIKAIEQLIICLETQQKETVSNVDLILKWFTIRFFDTNPSMLNKALDYLQQLFNVLSSIDYHLNDLEANSFVPYLILKSGDPKDNVRRDVRTILKLLCKVYPACKMFSFVLEGLKSKVSKQRTELLEELGVLIDTFGISVCQPSPAHALKTIASFIGERDNGVRNAALNTIVVAYHILGESVYKYVGNLKDKDQSYLDERIKRSAKDRDKAAKEQPQKQPPPQQTQRPKTAPAKSQPDNQVQSVSNTTQRIVKRTYQLDLEPEEDWEPVCPNLIQHDLDCLDGPIVKPTRVVRPTYNDSLSNLADVADVSTGLDKVITQIMSGNIDTCINGLIQIDAVMKSGKVDVLSGHVDHIVQATTKQFKMGVGEYLLDPNLSNHEVMELFRCLLSTLLSIFDKSSLGRKGSLLMLKELIQALLTIILDQQVEKLEGGPQIIRFVNMSVVKIINKSDPTNITCAIISLIKECLQSETCSSNFLDLVTKCLWKVLNLVPEMVNDLNLDRVLYECHRFFQAFPSSSWKSRPNLDMPIRTIKTLLHNLTKLKGQKILKHTKMIDTSDNVKSEVELYLLSVLNKSNFKQEDGMERKVQHRKMSKTHEILSEIFSKIGTNENTREGLNDLFDFKKKYPEADVEPFLKKTAPHFQKYINNMLAEIEEERKRSKNSDFVNNKTKSDSNKSDEEEECLDADYYREKLKELRARCGLDSNNAENEKSANSKSCTTISTDEIDSSDFQLSDNRSRTDVFEEGEEMTTADTPSVKQSVDVTSLKARLERIKKMANS